MHHRLILNWIKTHEPPECTPIFLRRYLSSEKHRLTLPRYVGPRNPIALTHGSSTWHITRKERGVTGTNVAAAIFFWPAMIGTYKNTEEAIEAAQARQKHLEKVGAEKNCKII